MNRSDLDQYHRAGVETPLPRQPFGGRWYRKLALLGITIVLLSLAFAPLGQFYLAWVGLVPWLLMVRETRSQRAAFFWSWVGGTCFFIANMWWLVFVTGPGMVALMMFLGLYWGVAALVIRGAGLLQPGNNFSQAQALMPGLSKEALGFERFSPVVRVLFISIIWVTLEWVRGCFPFNGLPWLFLGHAQTPILPMCQVADFSGIYGVSFWVMMINALVALLIIHRFRVRRLLPAMIVTGTILIASLGYGVFRMNERTTSTGPKVLVIQPNYRQSNSGDKGASVDEIVNFHMSTTEEALRKTGPVDLVVWSETMMPQLNRAYRTAARGFADEKPDGTPIPDLGLYLDGIHQQLQNLCRENHVALLTGGSYCSFPKPREMDRRNSAYFFTREGVEDETLRYDKIHLVPWGEYIPFKETVPLLYRLFVHFVPESYGGDTYTLTAGHEDAMTVFPLIDRDLIYRFVTPICFEDIDAALVARMFHARDGSNRKRADFIVNITNDGWFRANEMPQHFQAAVFRSIENRAPTARSVNTGISGFVNSVGRVNRSNLVPPGKEGWAVATLLLDGRVTLYTRYGDVFAMLCFAATIVVVIRAVVLRRV